METLHAYPPTADVPEDEVERLKQIIGLIKDEGPRPADHTAHGRAFVMMKPLMVQITEDSKKIKALSEELIAARLEIKRLTEEIDRRDCDSKDCPT